MKQHAVAGMDCRIKSDNDSGCVFCRATTVNSTVISGLDPRIQG